MAAVERFLFRHEVTAEQTWTLVAWCHAQGASELTVDLLGLVDHPEPFNDRFRAAMAGFRLPDAPREKMVTYLGDERVRPAPLWRLEPASIAVLRGFMERGFFTHPAGEWETGCMENPTLYRDGQVMFGIVSHEQEGVVRLRPEEEAGFRALGIASRDHPEWI